MYAQNVGQSVPPVSLSSKNILSYDIYSSDHGKVYVFLRSVQTEQKRKLALLLPFYCLSTVILQVSLLLLYSSFYCQSTATLQVMLLPCYKSFYCPFTALLLSFYRSVYCYSTGHSTALLQVSLLPFYCQPTVFSCQ